MNGCSVGNKCYFANTHLRRNGGTCARLRPLGPRSSNAPNRPSSVLRQNRHPLRQRPDVQNQNRQKYRRIHTTANQINYKKQLINLYPNSKNDIEKCFSNNGF